MSEYLTAAATRGAHALVTAAEQLFQQVLADKGQDTPAVFPNTAYYLPVILGLTGLEVQVLGQLDEVLARARSLLTPLPADGAAPSLADALNCGLAALLAAETMAALRFACGQEPEPLPGLRLSGGTVYPAYGESGGHLNGPIDDARLRGWGIQLVDHRISGVAVIIGAAPSNEVAVKIIRELQHRNVLVLLCGQIIRQLHATGVEMGYDTYLVPLGFELSSAIYAVGFAVRAALTFGGRKGGQTEAILQYNQNRVPAFVLALGNLADAHCAVAAGALNFGFPVIADSAIPGVPAGDGPLVAWPWANIPGEDDLRKATRLVQKCVDVRGIKVKVTEIPVPVPYGSAFEGEVVRRADMRVEFGGKNARAFEYLRMAGLDEVEDGQIDLIGPDFASMPVGGAMDVGLLVEVAGRKMQLDFEPVLERQLHYFINGASGVQHIGQRDIVWLRLSKNAVDKGFTLKHFGDIIHARLHADFGTIVDKVQVKIITNPAQHTAWLEKARAAYDYRNRRLADLTDEKVDTFYSCTLCQSFAPDHVCVVSPERLGLCGAYNWLDCQASHEINPTGPNQPIVKSDTLDNVKGYWAGINDFVEQASHGSVPEVSLYSITENPMSACGCFESIVMVIPETNGVMVVSREDPGMTPAGMTFSTLAGIAGGGVQTPGVMGVGKFYLVSPKFISANGGLKRVVWMSRFLKDTMTDELKAAAVREGAPDLLDKIADETLCTDLDALLAYLEQVNHPALAMEPIF